MASLQEQLLQAGLVDKKKAKKIKQDQRKQAKQQPKGSIQVNEALEQVKRDAAAKAENDRTLNQQQQAAAQEKAVHAQIVQLITLNRIDRQRGDVAYQFSDGTKIKKLYVTEELQGQLSKGKIAIARSGSGYELVPVAVADKISQRSETTIVLRNSTEKTQIEENDPYADYQIPDDLMW